MNNLLNYKDNVTRSIILCEFTVCQIDCQSQPEFGLNSPFNNFNYSQISSIIIPITFYAYC